MHAFWIILLVVAIYFLLAFVVLRLVAPFMGFKQYKPPHNLPPEIRQAIVELESRSIDQMSYLKNVYDWCLGRWEHSRLKAGLFLPKLFKKDLVEIWHTQGFVYCTSINFVVYVLLANSKFFTDDDVKIVHVFLNFVPHQYLKVRVGGKWIDIDPAGAGIRNQPLGTHASIFG